ncbi:MAG: nucleotidyl transferase AbiEii/AbiGii toxin family protein [Clostridia bacterium]
MNTSKQLKDLINNKAKAYDLSPQVLLTRFFMERFLGRISESRYRTNFILKGGILISSMVGIDSRMTKDMDLTVKNLPLNEIFIKQAICEITNMQVDDETKFELLDLKPIREEFDYSGFRARLSCIFDKTQNVIQIDITTGDVITPRKIQFGYKLLLEKRAIDITCYPIETILAEKLESILSKNITTTRMKDFYDCYLLGKLYFQNINKKNMILALRTTAKNRNTENIFDNVHETIDAITNDGSLQFMWLAYSSQFNYSKDIKFEDTINQITSLLKRIDLL